MFLIWQHSEPRLLTYPRLANIPHETSGVPPRQLRFSFETPTTPQRLHLILQGLNFTHTKSNYYLHISIDVHPRAQNLVQYREKKKIVSVMSIKAFNQSTGMDLSKPELQELKCLYEELKNVEEQERQLYLKGMNQTPELLATRKFLESEIDKWRRKLNSSKGMSSQPSMITSNETVGPKEREWRRRVAVKRLSLRGMEVLIPETLNGALSETNVEVDDQDQGEEAEYEELKS